MSSLRRRNGVPARGSETTKPGVSSTGQSLLKGNRDVRCIHFLVRKFSTGSLRLERRYCSQCCYVWRGRRLALDLHPCRHSRRRLGDCFPQALTTSVKRKRGLRKGTPLAHEALSRRLGKISEARIACERHSEIPPASPAKLTKFSMTSLRHRKGSPKGVQKRQSPVLPTPG